MVLGSNKDKWIHPEEALMNGKVTYHVKFIGVTEVDDVRGMDVVRQAMQKLKFSRHIKRSEGSKPPKVDLTINVNGLQIVDQRTKITLHDIPLQRVSFCADDKQDKRLFSFIAKRTDGKQYCYGLDSLHEANSITLTIGQAFELAYEKFLKSDKAVTSKRVIELSRRIESLEKENTRLKQRIQELESTRHQAAPSPASPPHRFASTDQSHPATSSVSHAFSNQNSGNGDHVTKSANLDQMIASMEKARTSLSNLKDYVRKKKLQKMQNNDSSNKAAAGLLARDNSVSIAKNEKIVGDISTSIEHTQLPSSGRDFHDQRKSDNGTLWPGTFEKLTFVEKDDEKNFSQSTPNMLGTSLLATKFRETEIGDLFHIQSNPYENCDADTNPDLLPPVPPKPPSMMESTPLRNHSESTYSASGSDLSSLDSMSGHSFSFFPVADHCMNRCESQTASSFSPRKDHFSATLHKFSGQDGYMELRAKKTSEDLIDNAYIDSTYDSVCKLMEAIRAGDVRVGDVIAGEINPNIPEKDRAKERSFPVQRSNHALSRSFPRMKTGSSQRPRSSSSLFSPAHRQMGLGPPRDTMRPFCPTKSPLLSTAQRKFQLQAPPGATEKDVFDMPPFTPPPNTPTFASFTLSPSTPTLVRLPSPNDVFPVKCPSRRSPSKVKDNYDQPTNELPNDTSELEQCGYEKAAFPLDLFDPLKSA